MCAGDFAAGFRDHFKTTTDVIKSRGLRVIDLYARWKNFGVSQNFQKKILWFILTRGNLRVLSLPENGLKLGWRCDEVSKS